MTQDDTSSVKQPPAQPIRILIVFYSRFGACRELAFAVQQGVNLVPDALVDFIEVGDEPLPEFQGSPGSDNELQARRTSLLNQLARADALIVGGPAYFGSVASPIKRFFEDLATASSTVLDRTRPWHHYLFQNKPGAAFITSATPHGGNEQALHSILTMMMHLGMLVVTPGQHGPILEHGAAPYGPTAITGPSGQHALSTDEIAEAQALGQRIAEIAWFVRTGRQIEAERLHAARHTSSTRFDPSA